jgi:F0F1-type ATP synthase gamma subunit
MDPTTASRLERARRRVDSSTPYSPEWQAAIEELEEAEAEITCLAVPRHADERDLLPTPGSSLGDAA